MRTTVPATKDILRMMMVFWGLGAILSTSIVAEPKPNIIVILSDDVGLSRIGCYGGGPFKTPHLDRLAATGLRFDRCYSMPLCGPSRAALLTGKYPFRTGATNNSNSEINPAIHPTIPAVLQRTGYVTCAIGKLGQSAPPDDAAAPRRLGFDESVLWMGRGTPDRYWRPRYYRNGEVVHGQPDEYGPDLTHAFLVDFMKRHRDRPFFVYYSAVLTHGPFTRTPDSTDDQNLVVDMVAYLDKQMGQLVADLERLQLRDNTILLFTSDNGPYGKPLGTVRGQPMLGAKGDTTEGGVREPLIVNCPGRVPSGRVCTDLTDFTDFFPTVLELAGIKAPDGLQLDGHSIAPQILGKPGQPRPWVYAQVSKDFFIADHRYKLYGDGKFVDISDSPVAEKPVAKTDEAGAEAKQRLATALATLRAGMSKTDAEKASPRKAKPQAPIIVTPEQLKADLKLLAELQVIASADEWVGSAQLDGEQVASLIVKGANRFEPANDTEHAIAILNREGIINSVAYWKDKAIAGRQCDTGNVARLIHKLAGKLRAR